MPITDVFCKGNETIRVDNKVTTPPLVRSWMQLSLHHRVASTADPVNLCLAENVAPPKLWPKMNAWAVPVLGVLECLARLAADAF